MCVCVCGYTAAAHPFPDGSLKPADHLRKVPATHTHTHTHTHLSTRSRQHISTHTPPSANHHTPPFNLCLHVCVCVCVCTQVFYRMGLDDRDIVALSGAHTLGRARPERSGQGQCTHTPTHNTHTRARVHTHTQLASRQLSLPRWTWPGALLRMWAMFSSMWLVCVPLCVYVCVCVCVSHMTGVDKTKYTEKGPGTPGGQSWTVDWLVFNNG